MKEYGERKLLIYCLRVRDKVTVQAEDDLGIVEAFCFIFGHISLIISIQTFIPHPQLPYLPTIVN